MSDLDRYIENIMQVYATATEDDKLCGAWWYPLATDWCRFRSGLYDISLAKVAGVLAATSPRLQWDVNKRVTQQIIGNHVTNKGTFVAGVFTRSVLKANRILAGEKPTTVLTGPKTNRFYRNIMGNQDCVTIDSWAARVAGFDGKSITRSYDELESAYQLAAFQLGIPPSTLQATTWIVQRGRP